MKERLEPKEYSFKQMVKKDIPSSNWLTANIDNYPAKFIPQIPYYVLKNFIKPLEKQREEFVISHRPLIIDPFAGSGTTGLVAAFLDMDAILLDLNPVTNVIASAKVTKLPFKMQYGSKKTKKLGGKVTDSIINVWHIVDQAFTYSMKDEEWFRPKWNNIDYWYLPEFKAILMNVWNYIHGYRPIDYYPGLRTLLRMSAIELSSLLSYNDHQSPKFYRSKYGFARIDKYKEQLKIDKYHLNKLFASIIIKKYKMMKAFTSEVKHTVNITHSGWYKHDQCNIHIEGGKDSNQFKFATIEQTVDAIVTSPPYMHAIEYNRFSKPANYWLGIIDDNTVKEDIKKEIGHTKEVTEFYYLPEKLQAINSIRDEYHQVIMAIEDVYKGNNSLKKTFLSYYSQMWNIINRFKTYLENDGVFAMFVGNPRMAGYKINSNEIFYDMMEANGLKIVEWGKDPITARRMGSNRKGNAPDAMKYEWLIVGRKFDV